MQQPEFREIVQAFLAFLVIVGGGAMVWFGKAPGETIYPVIGIILGFYFGAAQMSAIVQAATRATAEAVTRAFEERGFKP